MGNLVSITGKLEKLIPRLGTDADGEVVATVRAIERALKSNGNDWHDLAAALKAKPEPIQYQHDYTKRPAAPELHRMAVWLMNHALPRMNENGKAFVTKMALTYAAPTQKQEAYLRDLYRKYGGPNA